MTIDPAVAAALGLAEEARLQAGSRRPLGEGHLGLGQVSALVLYPYNLPFS
jgi:hypothetical protein